MESILSLLNLPFSDNTDLDFSKIRGPDCNFEDLHPTLPSNGSLLGADDVLAQFLSGDEPLEEPDLNGPTTLHCEICKKQFDNAKKYYGHLRVHSKDNLWICDKCPNEKFSTKQQLMKHSLTHKPLERVWQCPQCDMSFEALWRLQQHLFAKHLDYRPHKCDKCEMAFHKLSDLKKHQDTHNDVKKYACTVCDAKFKDRSNLRRHMTRHGKEKPFPCPGCGNRFTQLASMKRHSRICPLAQNIPAPADKTIRKNHCRVCGMTFQYKSALLEHCVRQHSSNPPPPTPEPIKEKTTELHVDTSRQVIMDTNRTVDNIVDDILSAEDDYLRNQSSQLLNYNHQEENPDNLMQIELLKDINHMHYLDDELLYNDIDFESFQTMCNTDMDYTDRNELLFDLTDGRSIDQDLMNALYQVKGDNLPDELLNESGMLNTNEKENDLLNPSVSVNECATIFESDVDLEASTNLAANLNQLIGENSVQYISTEHDDTFIISLNSEIDAEQLTDMLNIGLNPSEENNVPTEKESDKENTENASQPLVVRIENLPEEDNIQKNTVQQPILVKIEPVPTNAETVKAAPEHPKEVKKSKTRVLYFCRKCNKVFNKKDNYKSHRATHDPSLWQHLCRVCDAKFGYRSTLNKHMASQHTPRVKPEHACVDCGKTYSAAWMLKRHRHREHEMVFAYECKEKNCGKKFYDQFDLDMHQRFHKGERRYQCDICHRRFFSQSHLNRHVKKVDCTKHKKKLLFLKTLATGNMQEIRQQIS